MCVCVSLLFYFFLFVSVKTCTFTFYFSVFLSNPSPFLQPTPTIIIHNTFFPIFCFPFMFRIRFRSSFYFFFLFWTFSKRFCESFCCCTSWEHGPLEMERETELFNSNPTAYLSTPQSEISKISPLIYIFTLIRTKKMHQRCSRNDCNRWAFSGHKMCVVHLRTDVVSDSSSSSAAAAAKASVRPPSSPPSSPPSPTPIRNEDEGVIIRVGYVRIWKPQLYPRIRSFDRNRRDRKEDYLICLRLNFQRFRSRVRRAIVYLFIDVYLN